MVSLRSMPPAISQISQVRLDQLLADIGHHIPDGERWQTAITRLSSIKDFSMGETHLCSARAALQNCEQIKGYFSEPIPKNVEENLDAIMEEIRHLQVEHAPDFTRLLTNPLLLAGVIIGVFYFFVLR